MSRARSWVRRLVLSILPLGMIAADACSVAAAPMTFRLVKAGDESCRGDCSAKIVAEGSIEAHTPGDLLETLRHAPAPGGVLEVLVSSPGGDVHAAMEVGAILRQYRLKAVVARLDLESPGAAKSGFCASACIYMVMGAIRRRAVAGSHVCLHRMSIVATGPGGWTRRGATKDLFAEVSGYARRMGVSADLVSAAEAQDFDHVTPMSARDMARWRFLPAESE